MAICDAMDGVECVGMAVNVMMYDQWQRNGLATSLERVAIIDGIH